MRRLLRRSDDSSLTRPIWIVVIAALLVIDLVVVGWALSATRAAPDVTTAPWTAPPATERSPSPDDATDLSPEGTTQPPESTPAPEESPDIGARLLVAGGDGVLWRAVVGSCEEGGGSVEVSDDAGASWSPAPLEDPQPATVIALVNGPEPAQASVIYGDADCALVAQRTFVDGLDWEESPAVLEATSYVTPDGELVLAGDEVETPCDDPIMARGPSAVLCADGLRVGEDGAWSAPIPGVLAVSPYDEDHVVIARAATAECEGVAVSLVSLASGSDDPIACAEVTTVADVAIGASAATAWTWSGDQVVAVPLT